MLTILVRRTSFRARTRNCGVIPSTSRSAKVMAATSLVLWLGVIFFGRMIMYNGTLLLTLGL